MTASGAKVLFGDSTPSSLPPDVLDVLAQLVQCVRDVGNGVGEITALLAECDEIGESTSIVVSELDAFLRQSEIGLRATASASISPELLQHGEEAIAGIRRMVEGWRRQYMARHESQNQNAARRTDEIQQNLTKAMERFLLPRRHDSKKRSLRHVLDGTSYIDTATIEPLDGVRLELALRDSEPEVPRKIRSLIGKGARVQIGTKLSRIRRNEEPAYFSLDDMVVLEAEVAHDRARLQLAKKPGSEVFAFELVLAEDGMRGAGRRPDGVGAPLPITDRPVMEALWNALQSEARRIFAGPATLTKLVLQGEEVDGAGGLLDLAEHLVDLHRPMIRELAAHSPNDQELSIKIETADGRREEHWVRRDELAQHLLGLPDSVLARLAIPELYPHVDPKARIAAPGSGAIHQPHRGNDSERIDLGEIAAGIPGAPTGEVTEDISLHDLLLESDVSGLDDDVYAGPTRVRSR